MNAVEIEEAVSELAKCKFDPNEFPYQFLLAFGKKILLYFVVCVGIII